MVHLVSLALLLPLLVCGSLSTVKRPRSNELDDLLYLNRGYARASAACEAGRLTEALTIAETVLEGCSEMLGEEHEDTVRVRRLTAAILHRLGRHEEALELHFSTPDENELEQCSDTQAAAVVRKSTKDEAHKNDNHDAVN